MSTVTIKKIPYLDGFTWTKIVEPDNPKEGALPLMVLHGGPGFCHNYVSNLAELADKTGRTVVLYDQYGCGNSTLKPDAPKEFWTPRLFVEEFYNQIEHLGFERYHVLGQSWGGMLTAEIAVTQPQGMVTAMICNSPASMDLWVQAANELIAELPQDVQDTLARHEADGTYDDPEYVWATKVYDMLHVHRMAYTPQEYLDSEEQVAKDPTVYYTMNGPNEFHVVGTMKEWNIIPELGKVTVPTLVLAGEFDEATPLVWTPFVEHIANATSYVVKGASHCSHLEKPEEVFGVVSAFMERHE